MYMQLNHILIITELFSEIQLWDLLKPDLCIIWINLKINFVK